MVKLLPAAQPEAWSSAMRRTAKALGVEVELERTPIGIRARTNCFGERRGWFPVRDMSDATVKRIAREAGILFRPPSGPGAR